MANSQDPHRPFAGSDGEIKQFGKHIPVSRTVRPKEAEVHPFLPDLPGVRTELAQYYTSAHRCDETVGEILRALDESDASDNTLVMFLSDNGMSMPFAKTNCYLHSTHTPWIARWPGHIKAGQVDTKHFISGIDYMPTIIEAAGLDSVDGMDGKSFLSLLVGGAQTGRDKVFTVFEETVAKLQYPMRCVQTGKYGYIYNAWSDGRLAFKSEAQGGLAYRAMAASTDPKVADRVKLFVYRVPEELYDLESDPNCLHNLVETTKDGTLADMRKLLLKSMTETNDPILPAFKAFLETGKQIWKPDEVVRRPRAKKAEAVEE